MKCTVFVTALFVYVVTIGVDGAKDDHVYLMEVKLPTLEERGEDIEIYHINQFLGSSYGVNAIYRFKIIGEPRAIAILKVQNACSWNKLTTTFVQMGEDFYVTSLYEGESLADDLGVNETLIGEGPSGFPDSNLYFIDVTFAPGKTTPTVLHNVTEKILNLRAEDTRLAFYKILGQVPARILVFATLLPSKADSLHATFNCTDVCNMKLTAIQNLNTYVSNC
ncbi:uncharacterized protein [Haliotis cracherodii]|uniref:uncharacterized protein n=1 Tax=Haliotis cracherodii TaxID=6455 RepID=UPI0039E7F3D6